MYTYIYNSSDGDYNKRFCKGKDTKGTLLEIEDKDDLYYDMTVNSYGEVIDLKISNDDFGLSLSDPNGLSKKDIKSDKISEPFDIHCDGTSTEPEESLVCIITKEKRYCNVFGFNYERSVENA